MLESDPDARVAQVLFHETAQVEIRFADGRELVWSGNVAAELREAVDLAVRRGLARQRSSAN